MEQSKAGKGVFMAKIFVLILILQGCAYLNYQKGNNLKPANHILVENSDSDIEKTRRNCNSPYTRFKLWCVGFFRGVMEGSLLGDKFSLFPFCLPHNVTNDEMRLVISRYYHPAMKNKDADSRAAYIWFALYASYPCNKKTLNNTNYFKWPPN